MNKANINVFRIISIISMAIIVLALSVIFLYPFFLDLNKLLKGHYFNLFGIAMIMLIIFGILSLVALIKKRNIFKIFAIITYSVLIFYWIYNLIFEISSKWNGIENSQKTFFQLMPIFGTIITSYLLIILPFVALLLIILKIRFDEKSKNLTNASS